jgi:transposase
MKVLFKRCAGLDVHKAMLVACLRIVSRGKARYAVRKFDTMIAGLLALAEWLEAAGCTHGAMEATGSYWKPVWHILEGRFELVLANAAHIRNVPGRKSDLNDATWIADLLAHGLIRSSLVSPAPIAELRDLTRTRKQLGREIVQHTQRIQRVLEDANIKLSTVSSDVVGVSGRRILRALIDGESDPERLAALGSDRLKCSREELVEALRGRITAHHRFLLSQHLRMLEELERAVSEFEARIEECIKPFRTHVERLSAIPGLGRIGAQVILAEIGADMNRFASARHLLSWAGLCPRLDESAGKHRSTRVRKGAPWLKPVLVQCAMAAARRKNTYPQAQFLRLKSRRGPKKATIAVAATILTDAYHLLRDGIPYQDLGPHHFIQRDQAKIARRLAHRLRTLGYEVELREAA